MNLFGGGIPLDFLGFMFQNPDAAAATLAGQGVRPGSTMEAVPVPNATWPGASPTGPTGAQETANARTGNDRSTQDSLKTALAGLQAVQPPAPQTIGPMRGGEVPNPSAYRPDPAKLAQLIMMAGGPAAGGVQPTLAQLIAGSAPRAA